MKKTLTIILAMMLTSFTLYAQKELEKPNMRRAMAIINQQPEEATRILMDELNSNPNNGYAHSLIAQLYIYSGAYEMAIQHADLALKYIPKREEYHCVAYLTKARAYGSLGEHQKAVKEYTSYISLKSDNPEAYSLRGWYYYRTEKYEQAQRDCKKALEMDKENVNAYYTLGLIEKKRGNYESAVRYFNSAKQNDNCWFEVYYESAEALLRLGKHDEAATDLVKAMSTIQSQNIQTGYAYQYALDNELINEIADSSLISITSRLMIQANKEPDNPYWKDALGTIYFRAGQYEKSLDWFAKLYYTQYDGYSKANIALCYNNLGVYDQALAAINQALAADSTNAYRWYLKSEIYYNLGNIDSTIAMMDKAISLNPEYHWYYYLRGRRKRMKRDYNGAIEDENISIVLNPSYTYGYLERGHCYLHLGDMEHARLDYQKVIETDTTDDHISSMYAHFYLGNEKEAVRLMNSLIKKDTKGNYYEAACICSLMNRKKEAIGYLRKAMEKGWNEFMHLSMDKDMDNVRNEKEFVALVKEYKAKNEAAKAKIKRLF